MGRPILDHPPFADQAVEALALGGKLPEAVELCSQQMADRFSDLGLLQHLSGDSKSGLALLERGQELCPASQSVFRSLLHVMLKAGPLRGGNREKMVQQLRLLLEHKVPWAETYRPLLWMPTGMNLEFVSGRCNLHCRMCLGSHARRAPARLRYMPAEMFAGLLAAAPTIETINLSSGDSDPLLHPHLEQIFQIARQHQVDLEIYTNGQALVERACSVMVDSGVVNLINFSVDAATAETYARIRRGGDFDRVVRNMEMLRDMKAHRKLPRPRVQLSFVAMADNIEELPAFVALAQRLGAQRVYVEDLIGWRDTPSENQPAAENPRWQQAVREAQAVANGSSLELLIPPRLQALLRAAPQESRASVARSTPPCQPHCHWLNRLWVWDDGSISPCCTVHRAADLGSVQDGPLFNNEKFNRVKSLLMEGKVLPRCASQTMCIYVQQQLAAKIPLRFITPEELGECALPPRAGTAEGATR